MVAVSARRARVSVRASNVARLLSSFESTSDLTAETASVNRINIAEKGNKKGSQVISSLATLLKACAKEKDLRQGRKIHAHIQDRGFLPKNTFLGSLLISMYAKCGAVVRAQEVFDELTTRNVVAWSALIAGYTQHGLGREALECFCQMQRDGISPNSITYMSVLKACGISQNLKVGKKVHDDIIRHGLLGKDVALGTALVDMYAKCGALTKARTIFDELPLRNVTSWSVLIAGHVRNGFGKEALGCFHQMRRAGLSPDSITYTCALKACAITPDLNMGVLIHDEVVSQGLLDTNVVLGNALVDMYAKCGALTNAKKLLDKLAIRDTATWGALIAGYSQHGCGQEAINCYHWMQKEGLPPDAITYSCVLKACGMTKDVDMGKKIHNEIASQGLLKSDVVLGTALVDMYGRCGMLREARDAFNTLTVRSVASWSALIAVYAQYNHGREALGCLHRMRKEGLSPNESAYTNILKACGITRDIDMGVEIHDEISSKGLLEKNVILGNALVDMYAKCGVLARAQKILDELPMRGVASWTALIAGYAQEGQSQEALMYFKQMRKEGVTPNIVSWNAMIGGYAQQGRAEEAMVCFRLMEQEGSTSPDAITFLNVLTACSHSGLVDEGQMYFDKMREKYGIIPDEEHCTCMVDMFGRARLFDKAMRVIKTMPSPDYPPIWSALLSACREWGNVKIGSFAFTCGVQLNGFNPALYVLMSDIYVAAGMHEEAENIELTGIINTT